MWQQILVGVLVIVCFGSLFFGFIQYLLRVTATREWKVSELPKEKDFRIKTAYFKGKRNDHRNKFDFVEYEACLVLTMHDSTIEYFVRVTNLEFPSIYLYFDDMLVTLEENKLVPSTVDKKV